MFESDYDTDQQGGETGGGESGGGGLGNTSADALAGVPDEAMGQLTGNYGATDSEESRTRSSDLRRASSKSP